MTIDSAERRDQNTAGHIDKVNGDETGLCGLLGPSSDPP
jgi:hypothetical protein